MPDSPTPNDNRQRLALIERLWIELEVTPRGSKRHEALLNRIRQETNIFRQALDDDPGKF